MMHRANCRASSDKKLKDVWEFHTVVDVEVAHRCCRVNMINGCPDPEYVQLAERILKVRRPCASERPFAPLSTRFTPGWSCILPPPAVCVQQMPASSCRAPHVTHLC
jgi:hypothetical protein